MLATPFRGKMMGGWPKNMLVCFTRTVRYFRGKLSIDCLKGSKEKKKILIKLDRNKAWENVNCATAVRRVCKELM